MKQENPELEIAKPGTIENHRLYFANYNEEWGGGTSCIIPSPEDTVIGTTYLMTDKHLDFMVQHGLGYQLATKTAKLDVGETEVYVLLPPEIGEFVPPSQKYVERIREGLKYFYPVSQVDAYIEKMLRCPQRS
jgi:hypothetical protein